MQKYKVIARSHGRIIGLGFIWMIIYFLIAGLLFPILAYSVKYILFVLLLLTVHFSFHKLTKAKTEWEVTDEGISIKWVTMFPWSNVADLNIKWSDIKKYRELTGRGYDLFKIYQCNGQVFEIGHGGIFITDDFNTFYEVFQEMFIKMKHPTDWKKYYKRTSSLHG